MRRFIITCVFLVFLAACGPPPAFRAMHAAFNAGKWADVTEKYADMGRPRKLDGVSYARIAESAAAIYEQSRSPAYLELALECYDLATAGDPSLADEHCFAKGLLLAYANEVKGAVAAYREVLRINPRHVPAAVQLVYLLRQAKHPAEAISAGQSLLKASKPVSPMLLAGLFDLSQAYLESKRPDEALQVLRHAGAIGPGEWEPDLLYAVAMVYEAQGQKVRACAAMRKAMAALPQNSDRRATFEACLRRLGPPPPPPPVVQAPSAPPPSTQPSGVAASISPLPAPPAMSQPAPSVVSAARAPAQPPVVSVPSPPTESPASQPAPPEISASPPQSPPAAVAVSPPTPPPPASRPAPATASAPSPPEDTIARAEALTAQAATLADHNEDKDAIRLLAKAVQLAPALPAPSAQLAVLYYKTGERAAAVRTLENALQHNPDNEILRKMLQRIHESSADGQDRK